MSWVWWLSGYGGSDLAGTIEEVGIFPRLDAIAAADSDDDERGA